MNKNKNPETITNLKKAQSLLLRIIKMKEENKYCIDIMQQNLAVIGLLKKANELLMKNHLNSCFKNAVESKNREKQQKMIDEIIRVTKLSNK